MIHQLFKTENNVDRCGQLEKFPTDNEDNWDMLEFFRIFKNFTTNSFVSF